MSIESFVTDWDRQRYEERKQIADEQRAELDAAIAACGPGALAYGVWVLRDVTGVLPEQRHYCCRREHGVGWEPKAPESDERLTAATHSGYQMNGMTVYPFRFSVHFSAIEEYRPVPVDQLAERRARRRRRKLESEQTEIRKLAAKSLFPEMYENDLRAIRSELATIESALRGPGMMTFDERTDETHAR